jgi:hypothetical protein
VSILSLGKFPERCPAVGSLSTPEDTIRRLAYVRKQNRYAVYDVLFGDTVRILHVRTHAVDKRSVLKPVRYLRALGSAQACGLAGSMMADMDPLEFGMRQSAP